MRLADMTWRDVRDYLTRSDALIIPVGTCEQHGPHLPLSTDTLIAEAFATRLADEMGLGKTAQALGLLAYLWRRFEAENNAAAAVSSSAPAPGRSSRPCAADG